MNKLIDYAEHKPTCQINQNWNEAINALTDTVIRDHDWEQAHNELYEKMNTCTCGLEKILADEESKKIHAARGESVIIIRLLKDEKNMVRYGYELKGSNFMFYELVGLLETVKQNLIGESATKAKSKITQSPNQ